MAYRSFRSEKCSARGVRKVTIGIPGEKQGAGQGGRERRFSYKTKSRSVIEDTLLFHTARALCQGVGAVKALLFLSVSISLDVVSELPT